MRERAHAIVMLAACASLVACEPAGPNAETPGATEASAYPVAAAAPQAPAGPPPTYPKAQPAGESARVEAQYPTPILVGRCKSLIANGPAEQVQEICTRALKLDPGNEEIRAALAAQ